MIVPYDPEPTVADTRGSHETFGLPWGSIIGGGIKLIGSGGGGGPPPRAPMPNVSGIVPENYTNYSGDPAFMDLQSRFASAFGGGFLDFSIQAFLTDAAYAGRILERIAYPGEESKALARQQSLDALIEYFRARSNASATQGGGGGSVWNPGPSGSVGGGRGPGAGAISPGGHLLTAGIGGGSALPIIAGVTALMLLRKKK